MGNKKNEEKKYPTWDDYDDKRSEAAGYGTFGVDDFSQSTWLEDVLSKVKNYQDFTYDLNGDALYQQYKDKYIQQGKMASADVMGQAAALTGGYGNSYAQSAGQQAYQASLNNLNDIIPELWQMAYDKHNMGKQDLYNQFGMLGDLYDREHTQHEEGYERLMDELGILQSDYYNGRDEKWRDEEMAYQKGRDKVADEQWQKQFDETMAYNKSKGNEEPTKEPTKEPKEPEEPKEEEIDVDAELNSLIKNGADKSEINNYLREALRSGYITTQEYQAYKNKYAPRGYAY